MKIRCPKCEHVATYRVREPFDAHDWFGIIMAIGFFVVTPIAIAAGIIFGVAK